MTRVPPYAFEMWRRRDFTLYLARANIKARNASTALGLLWWVLNPMLLAAVYYFVFGVIFRAARSDPGYLPFLICGLFAFYYTRTALLGGSAAILSNSRIITNVAFPRLSLILSSLIESFFGFLVSIAVLIAILLARGEPPQAQVLMLPIVLAVHTVMNAGLSALAARVTIPFRDVSTLLPYVLRIWLYLSPIMYGLERVPDRLRDLYILGNPLTPLLSLYRYCLLNEPLDASHWTISVMWSVLLLAVGLLVFIRSETKFVRYL